MGTAGFEPATHKTNICCQIYVLNSFPKGHHLTYDFDDDGGMIRFHVIRPYRNKPLLSGCLLL
jgi:hypothetical protein